MVCESCRAGDPECNAWIACDRQIAQERARLRTLLPNPEIRIRSRAMDSEGVHIGRSDVCRRCSAVLQWTAGIDEDCGEQGQVHAVLACVVCGAEVWQ